MKLRTTRSLGVIASALLAVACSSPRAEPPPAKVQIQSFTSSASAIVAGETATLNWITVNAVEIELLAGGSRVELGNLSPNRDSLRVSPTSTTVYQLRAIGRDGEVATESLTLEVQRPQAPVIAAFEAEPETIGVGMSSTLSWQVAGATSIEIASQAGESLDLGGKDPLADSIEVQPTETTIYELVAKGPGGEALRAVRVDVVPAPTLVARASPGTIAAGGSSHLIWETEGADRVIVKEGETLLFETTELLDGELEVTPLAPTTYTIEAQGFGGETSATVDVRVQPSITSFTTSIQAPVRVGMVVDLAWTTLGAEELVLTNDDGLRIEIPAEEVAEGATQAPVGTSGVFTLEARRGSEVSQRTLAFTVTEAPVILELTAGDGPVTAGPDLPAAVTIRWKVEAARSLALRAIPGGVLPIADLPVTEGELETFVTGPTTFLLEAENPFGLTSRQVQVEVSEAPSILDFAVFPLKVGQGELATVRWSTGGDTVAVEIEQDGVRLPEHEQLSGTFETQIAADTTFRLTAINSAGYRLHEERIVRVGAPLIDSFLVDREWAPVNGSVTFSWRSDGGGTLELQDQAGTTLFSTSDPETILQGSHTLQLPSTRQEMTYALVITNASGEDRRTVEVSIIDGPVIENFSAGPALITSGEALVFSWEVESDAFGVLPTLQLTDDHGGSYDIYAIDPNRGEATFPIPVAGSYVFTLEASTGGTTPSSATAAVDVVPAAEILSFTANPPFVTEPDQPVQVSWQVSHAASLELFSVDDEGQVGSSLFSATSDLDEGTISYAPTIEFPNVRMVVKNQLGTEVVQDLRIGVEPASLSFEADPVRFMRGSTTTLRWTTERADEVRLAASPWVETDERFIDISGAEGARKVGLGASTYVTGLIQFYDGFVFPFQGSLRRSARVHSSGVVSLNEAQESSPSVVAAIPSSNFPYMHLAPFWASLNRSAHGGEIWYQVLGSGPEQHLVIQYKNFSITNHLTAHLNFQVVLWRDGSFDFRYGDMSNPADQDVADGLVASIGHQNVDGTEGLQISRNQPVPGGLSHRTFHFPAIPHELTAQPISEDFVNIAGADDAVDAVAGEVYFATALVDPLPEGFVFPFAGQDRTSLRISRAGYVSFAPESSSENRNERLVQGYSLIGARAASKVHLAPYWTDLTLEPNSASGSIWYALRQDDQGRFLVIQWANVAHNSHKNNDLNFQVILREDGSFEYRYGTMTGGSGGAAGANGSLASIGFQEPNGVIGVDLSYNTIVPGLLNSSAPRGWRFAPIFRLPLEGELEVRPRGRVTYTMTASNGHSSHAISREVEALAGVELAASYAPELPVPGEPLTLRWSSFGAVDLRVFDADGNQLYRALPHELAGGSFTFEASRTEGIHGFVVRAWGASGDEVEQTFEIPIFPAFQIDEFRPSSYRILPSEGVSLSWRTINADGLQLEASPGGTIDLAGKNVETDSIHLLPEQTTTYVLTATSAGRILTSTTTVEVRSVSVDRFEASADEVAAGTPVTISWDTSGGGSLSLPGAPIYTDVSDSSPFEDISGSGTPLTLTTTTARAAFDFPAGFSFPYLGESAKTRAWVGASGFISFASGDSSSTKHRFPGSTSNRPRIGVFFDALNPGNVATTYWKHIEREEGLSSIIVQWKNARFNRAPIAGDLNFQVELYEDGSFITRYAKMSGSSDETPPTPEKALMAMGSTASIGYQLSSREGRQFSYDAPFPGGLEGRAFRVSAAPLDASGSIVVAPTETTDYELCTTGPTWTECRTIRIVVASPGELAISELQLSPVGGHALQWIELRNLSPDPIDLVGKTIRAGSAEHTISSANPLYVGPGEYAVLAASPSSDFAVDYVYGVDAFDLATAYSLEIVDGHRVLSSLVWDETWVLPGVSLSLDTRLQFVENVSALDRDSWCEGALFYDGQNRGTPGAHGTTCSSDFYDVDWFSDRPFIDIRDTGVKVPELMVRFKNAWLPEAAGFTFPFFGSLVTTNNLWAAGSGTIALGGYATTSSSTIDKAVDLYQQTISNTGLIAVAWGEAAPLADNSTLFHVERRMEDGMEVLILQWSNMGKYNTAGRITYQAQLWSNGDIVVAVEDTEGAAFNGSLYSTGLAGSGPGMVLPYFFKKPLVTPHSSILYKHR